MRTIWQRAGLALALGAAAWAAPALAQEQAAAAPAGGCNLATRSTNEIDAMLAQQGVALADFDTFCAGLASTRTGIDAVGNVTREFEESVALVVLRLYDIESGTPGMESSFALVMEPGNDDAARTRAYSRAYNLALAGVEQDRVTYVASVMQEMARLDGVYRAGVAPVTRSQQQPCAITYRATPLIEETIAARGALPDFAAYNTLCEALRVRGAGLDMLGAQLPAEGRLYTVVNLSVYDMATGATGNLNIYNDAANREPTEDDRLGDVWDTLQLALEGMAENAGAAFEGLDAVLSRNGAFYPVR